MPKYQVVMKGYFCIPNNNSFSNVQQENGRVVKGSGIIGFELDPPQQCLEEASGDLRAMGCSIFFKKCQEVNTVSNLVFLGVPNSISEDTVKETVDEVLQKLEDELIHDDKDYKLTGRQKEQWIKYAITKEYPGEMPWEDQAEKKKKLQAANNSHLAFVFHVHCPNEQRLATLLDRAKYRSNLWYEHWGVAFTVEQPGFTTPAGEKIDLLKWCSHMAQCIWRSKQHTSFCGTRVQVGIVYSGLECPDEKCPNCGQEKQQSTYSSVLTKTGHAYWLTQQMISADGSTKITSPIWSLPTGYLSTF